MTTIVQHWQQPQISIAFFLFLWLLEAGLTYTKQLPSPDSEDNQLVGPELDLDQFSSDESPFPDPNPAHLVDNDGRPLTPTSTTKPPIRLHQPAVVLTDLNYEVILAVIFGSMAGSCLLTVVVYCFCVFLPNSSCQILPRSSNWITENSAMASTENDETTTIVWNGLNDSSSFKNNSISLSPNTLDVLKIMFAKRERVTVPSLTTRVTVPKNAVLIDSYLLKSTGSQVSQSSTVQTPVGRSVFNRDIQVENEDGGLSTTEKPFTVAGSTVAATIVAANVSPERREAKQGLTGRPNSFFLDDDHSTDTQLESGGSFLNNLDQLSGQSAVPPPSTDILPSTTPDPFASFYGGSGKASPGRPSLSSTANKDSSNRIPYPFTNSTSTDIQPNVLSSGHFSVKDAPLQDTLDPFSSGAGDSLKSIQPNNRRPAASQIVPPNFPPQEPNNARIPPLSPGSSAPSWPAGNRRGNDGTNSGRMPPPFQARPPSVDTTNRDSEIQLETCSVGDQSTCNDALNEVCRVDDDGAATCLCRLGSARIRLREPCRGIWSYLIYIRINRVQDNELRFGPQFGDRRSRPYLSLERQVIWGVDSLMRASPFNTQYAGARLNSFGAIADDGLLANLTINIFRDTSVTGDANSLPRALQETTTEQLRLTQRRLGVSNLYVGSLLTAVPTVQDINECLSSQLNDCPANVSYCSNTVGSFTCSCLPGYGDRYTDNSLRSGRNCATCQDVFCNQHGVCLLDPKGQKLCRCNGWYIGMTCQTDGQVVAVACGSSAIALILIVITLVFLLRWSRSSSSSRGSNMSSTLGRSDISGTNTFTYIKNSPPLATLSHDASSLDNHTRMAYLVHPALLSQSQMATRRGSDQLLDSNFYEVRPPPGRLGPNQALIAAELLYRKQCSGSRDQLTGSDLSSLDSQTNQHKSVRSS